MAPMKIGVDFHIVPGKFQGSKRYLEELYFHLAKIRPDIKLTFCIDKDQTLDDKWREIGEIVKFDTNGSARRLVTGARKVQRSHNFDFFHFQYNVPVIGIDNAIVTIHDILFETHPQYFSYFYRTRLKLLTRFSARKAKIVFTVSDYSRDCISKVYNVDRVVSIPNGVNGRVFNMQGITRARSEVESQFGLRNFILCVSRIEPRKNQLELIKATEALSKTGILVPDLVFVGPKDVKYPKLTSYYERPRGQPNIIFLTGTSNEQLANLYKACSFFVYPSYAEGFGMPVVEALSCGCQVISSNTTAMSAFAYGAKLYPPGDTERLSQLIYSLLYGQTDFSMRSEISSYTLKEYSWHRSAQAFAQALDDYGI
jgi:glycosyltransferase involved in cell wall biosynthesis